MSVGSRHASAELAIYSVLQEALANAARYGSGPATVHLERSDREVSLRVDNPVRIQAAATGPQADCWVVRAVVPGQVTA
jgi:hypothetical protein